MKFIHSIISKCWGRFAQATLLFCINVMRFTLKSSSQRRRDISLFAFNRNNFILAANVSDFGSEILSDFV